MEDAVLVQRINSFVDIRFQDVSFTTVQKDGSGKKEILKSVSGEFRSGELTAIMGPSGAGKSTLMSCIAGLKVSNVSGNVFVNGKERSLEKLRKMSCYIMQRDELCPVLNVMELMQYAANLKLGNYKSKTEKEHLINQILETIGLSHSTATMTTKLSGGQKKRLAIALELINNPQVLFFDEPTSGLDSASSFQCVSLMKKLAREGRTIICVIHQPSSSIFEMFDHLYLLAKGQCIYQGSIVDVIRNISATIGVECPSYHSPADYAIDVASGLYGDLISLLAEKADSDRRLKNSIENVHIGTQRNSESHPLLENHVTGDDVKNNNEAIRTMSEKNKIFGSSLFPRWRRRNPPKDVNDVSYWIQFCVIFYKTIIRILRDPVLIIVRAAFQLVTAFVVGLTYRNIGDESSQVFNNIGFIIFVQLSLMFTALMATCLTYPLERTVLAREHLNNWHRLEIYYLAKTIADLPFEIFFSTIFVIIVYFMTSQPFDVTRFFMFWGMAVMTSLVAQSIGLALGAGLNLRAAVFMGPPVTIPFYLFSGFLIRFKEIPIFMRWLCYTSFIRYGFEGMMIAIYANDRPPLQCSQEFCFFKSPFKILQWFGLENSVYWMDLCALLVFFIILRTSTFFILRWKLNSKL